MDDVNEFINSVEASTHKLLQQNKKLQQIARTTASRKNEKRKKVPNAAMDAILSHPNNVMQVLPFLAFNSPKDAISSPPSQECLKSLPAVQSHASNGPHKSPNKVNTRSNVESMFHKADHVDLLLRKLGLHAPRNDTTPLEFRMCAACWSDPTKSTHCARDHRMRVSAMEAHAVAENLKMHGPTSWSTYDLYTTYRRGSEENIRQTECSDFTHPIYKMYYSRLDREYCSILEKFDAHGSMQSLEGGTVHLSTLIREHMEDVRRRVFLIRMNDCQESRRVDRPRSQLSPLSTRKLHSEKYAESIENTADSSPHVTSTISSKKAKYRMQVFLNFTWSPPLSRGHSPMCLFSLRLEPPVPCRRYIAWNSGLERITESGVLESNCQLFEKSFRVSYQHQYTFLSVTVSHESSFLSIIPSKKENRIHAKPIPWAGSHIQPESQGFKLSKCYANDITLQKGQCCGKTKAMQSKICSLGRTDTKTLRNRIECGKNEPLLCRLIMQFDTAIAIRYSRLPQPSERGLAKSQTEPHTNPSHTPFDQVAISYHAQRKPSEMTQSLSRPHTIFPWNALQNQKNDAMLAGIAHPRDTRPYKTQNRTLEPSTRFITNIMRELLIRAHSFPQGRTPSSDTQSLEEIHAKAMAHARNSNFEGVCFALLSLSNSHFPIFQVELMLQSGIDVNGRDELGNTLLILVAQQGSKRIAKLLLRNRAAVNAQVHRKRSKKSRVLLTAHFRICMGTLHSTIRINTTIHRSRNT